MPEAFWSRAPLQGLLRPDRWGVIIPRPGMTLDAQLNAVTRFALAYALLLALFRRGRAALAVAMIAAVLTAWVYYADRSSDAALKRRMESLEVETDPVSRDLRVRPTRDNPFMNVLVTDYAQFANRPPAADVTRADVQERAETAFDHNLYRDASDVFHRRSSSRPFYTTAATTIPNDQHAFARWLYDAGPTCKEPKQGGACAARLWKHLPGE